MGMLPDQLQSNISILAQLREQAQALETRIEQERQQTMLVRSQEQISRAERQATAAASAATSERGAPGHTLKVK